MAERPDYPICQPLPDLTGGYDDNDFVDSPPESLKCPVCLLVLREPHLLSCCGSHLCQVCIQQIRASEQPCPFCRSEEYINVLNKEKRRKVLELRVHCENSGNGCDWVGELGDLQRHLTTKCPYVEAVCRHGCGRKYSHCVLLVHEKDECPSRPIEMKMDTFTQQIMEKLTALETKHEKELASINEKLKEQEERHEVEKRGLREEKKEIYHQLEEMKRELTVLQKKVVIKKSPVPKEYAKDKLLVKDIPDSIDEEFFAMFVENRLGMDDGEDFTVDFRNNCAVLLFTQPYSDEEIQAMIKKLTSKKCKGQILSLERCEVNCSIIVSNITKKRFCSEEALEIYFESTYSGGRDVECVEMLGPNKAKVTFKDATVISRVLSKKHTELGLEVSISACTALDSFDEEYEDAQENKDDTDSPSEELHNSTSSKIVKEKKVDPPPPVVHPPVTLSIDPLIAKCLHFKPAVIDSVCKEIQLSLSVDDIHNTITISQTDSSPPDWPSTSTERLKYLLSEMLCRVDIVIPQSAATQLCPIIMQQCAQGGLQYAFGQGGNKVSVAGDTGLVTKLQQDVQELCSRTVQQAEVINLNPEDYAFLKGRMLPIVQKQHPSLKLKCHDHDGSLSVSGSIRDVAQLKKKLPQYLLHCRAPVHLQPLAIQFLQTGKGPEILQSMIVGDTNFVTKLVPFFTEPGSDSQSVSLFLLCTQDTVYKAENIAMKVADRIQLQTIDMSNFMWPEYGIKYTSLKVRLGRTYTFLTVIKTEKLILVSTVDTLPLISQAFLQLIEKCSVDRKVKQHRHH